MTSLHLDQRLHAYFDKIVKDFAGTAFGTFYLSNKKRVDSIIQEVESTMMSYEDLDDSSYTIKTSGCIGQYQ